MRRLINFFDYIRTPAIKIKSRQCLEDIKTCFNIENDIRNRKGGYFELSIGTDFFNDLLLIYKESLERKRHKYGYEIKFKITRDELKKLFDNGWSSREIADYHLSTYGIKISDGLAYWSGRKWGLC